MEITESPKCQPLSKAMHHLRASTSTKNTGLFLEYPVSDFLGHARSARDFFFRIFHIFFGPNQAP